MLILLICPLFDPACVAWNLYKAINKYTKHKARHILGTPAYIAHNVPMVDGTDIMVKDTNKQALKDLVNSADILHFSQYDWSEIISDTDFTFRQLMERDDQKILFHGHGGEWLLYPEKRIKACEQIGATMVTCSPIDEVVVSGIRWMPNILSTQEIEYNENRDFNGTLKACLANHAPEYKGITMVSYVFEYLKKGGYDVDFTLLKGIPREEALKIRANYHITIDNWTQGFFGMSALEGLALGHIVIARLDPMAREKWERKFGEVPPIADVKGMDECAKVVREYCADRELLKEHSIRNREWVKENYTEEKVVKMWIDLYEGLPRRKKLQQIYFTPISLDPEKEEVSKMFDGTATSGCLDGIMGNEEDNEYETQKIYEALTRLKLEHKDSLLDCGVGIGRLVPLWNRLNFRNITGVDISPEMLNVCSKKYPNVDLRIADLCNLKDFGNNQFDVSVLVYVFIHITDDDELDKAISEIERVTRNEVIIIQVMEAERIGLHGGHCRVREVYDIIKRFKKKKVYHFFKNYYEIKSREDSPQSWINKISILTMGEGWKQMEQKHQ